MKNITKYDHDKRECKIFKTKIFRVNRDTDKMSILFIAIIIKLLIMSYAFVFLNFHHSIFHHNYTAFSLIALFYKYNLTMIPISKQDKYHFKDNSN